MKFLIRFSPVAALLAPALVFAQGINNVSKSTNNSNDFGQFGGFIDDIVNFINDTIVPLIFAIAFLFFLWGVAKFFIIGHDAEEAKEEGRQYMLWGIGGFVVMVSVWGIVNLVAGSLGFSSQEEIQNIPNAPTENN